MNIQVQESNIMQNYNLPFAKQNKDAKAQQQGDQLTINASEMRARQNKKQQDRTKSLYEQIERLQESIQKVQGNEKLLRETKSEQLEALRKEIQEVQQQIVKIQEQEREEQLKEEAEKKAQEEEQSLTPEEREKKVQEAQQKMLSGIAGAKNKLDEATSNYNKAKEYTKKGQLGMGSKYRGNLSAVEVESLFNKAAKYGSDMGQALKEAQQTIYSAGKAAEAYQKHKTQMQQDKQEEQTEDKEKNQKLMHE